MADYWPIAPGYSWKAVVFDCPDSCSCPALDLWEVQGPDVSIPNAYHVGPDFGNAFVLEDFGNDYLLHGFYSGGTYFPAIGGPHSMASMPDGYSFQTDSVEKILVRDWNSVSDGGKSQYGITANPADVVVWVYYDLAIPFTGNFHHTVLESGVPPGTTIPQGSITAIDWFVRGQGLLATMDVDAASGNPTHPFANTDHESWAASLDCNGNGVFDHLDISSGASTDSNSNCIPDECEPGFSGSAYCSGDGTGNPCPCGAFGNLGEGCANTGGAGGATLSGSGFPSFSNDSFHLQVSGIPGAKAGLCVKGSNQLGSGNGNPVGDGLLCTAPQKRSQVLVSSGSGNRTMTNWRGQPFGTFPGAANLGAPTYYQWWYRDPANACTGNGFNFTNGWEVSWLP